MTESKKTVGAIDDFMQCWVLVTGASRGLGAAICKALAPSLGQGSVMVGLSRNLAGLNETKKILSSEAPGVEFVPVSFDLSSDPSSQAEDFFQKSTNQGKSSFQRFIIVHNAGSLGPLNHMKDLKNFAEINEYFNFNLGSAICLNNTLLSCIKETYGDAKIHVINISSLCAIQPMKSWSLYCTGKSAREMAFKCLALEYPEVDVLNYSPGPLEGDMQVEVRTRTADPELRKLFTDLHAEGKLVDSDDSARKMMALLKTGSYETGSHVDYYDC